MDLLAWLLVGLAATIAAKLALPWFERTALGDVAGLAVSGALIGGFASWLFVGGSGEMANSSLIGAFVGAAVALFAYAAVAQRRVRRDAASAEPAITYRRAA